MPAALRHLLRIAHSDLIDLDYAKFPWFHLPFRPLLRHVAIPETGGLCVRTEKEVLVQSSKLECHFAIVLRSVR
jgi:hypothetical protein